MSKPWGWDELYQGDKVMQDTVVRVYLNTYPLAVGIIDKRVRVKGSLVGGQYVYYFFNHILPVHKCMHSGSIQ